MRTRPVFESFNDFVISLYNKINEAESNLGNVDALNELIGGKIKDFYGGSTNAQSSRDVLSYLISGDGETSVGLNGMVTEASGKRIVANAQSISSYLSNKKTVFGLNTDKSAGDDGESLIISQKPLSKSGQEMNRIYSGTIKVSGNPETQDGKTWTINTNEKTVPLSGLLTSIFEYNLYVYSSFLNSTAAKQTRKGEESLDSDTQVKKFQNLFRSEVQDKLLQLDENTLSTDVKQVVEADYNLLLETGKASSDLGATMSDLDGSYQALIAGYYIDEFLPNRGGLLSLEYLKEIAPPTNKGTEVKGKVFTSQGTNFFGENKVVISEDGKASIAGIISRFNSISEIVVNGGASNKNTAREGGNEKLAADRRDAGIALLKELKTTAKVEQLLNATITPGTAKVQSDYEPSDAENQQVTFVITGVEKGNPAQTDKPVVIEKASEKNADQAIITRVVIGIGIDDYGKMTE